MTVVQDNIAGRDDTDDGERNLTRLGGLEGSRECYGPTQSESFQRTLSGEARHSALTSTTSLHSESTVPPEELQETSAKELSYSIEKTRASLSHATSLAPPRTFLAPKSLRAHGLPDFGPALYLESRFGLPGHRPYEHTAASRNPSKVASSGHDRVVTADSWPGEPSQCTSSSALCEKREPHGVEEYREDEQTLSAPLYHAARPNGAIHGQCNRGVSTLPPESNAGSYSGGEREVHESLARPSRSSLDTDDPGEKAAYKSPTSVRAPRRRNYTFLPPSGVSFFLKGHAMTGGDSPLPLLASVLLVCGVSGCWIATTGVWLWRDGERYSLGSGGIAVVIVFTYLLISTISSMAGAAFRDPGILPREFDLQPPFSYSSSSDTLTPLPRELRVRNECVTVKYCDTCKIYRPPRSSHCRLCGNCVEGIDHHCTYLRNCVGKRNYVSFLAFVSWASVATVYEDHKTFKEALQRSPGAAVSFAIGIVVVWPVLALLAYHIRLMYLNSTTIEQIRSQSAKGVFPGSTVVGNPFSYHSISRNILSASVGRPRIPSWIDPSGIHRTDERKVNPGVLARGK